MLQSRDDEFKHPRELLIFAAVFYVGGFVLAAFEHFEEGFIRSDALWLGHAGLFTGSSLWITQKLGHAMIGVWLVRSVFVVAVLGWLYTSYRLVDGLGTLDGGLFLSLVLGVLLYGFWLLTWRATATIQANKSE